MVDLNTFKQFAAALFSMLLLASCASPTPYKPAGDSGPGYNSQKIEENRYRVVFRGNEATPRETVEIYLLYRAAEITLQNGYDYFVITERFIEKTTDYDTTSPAVYGHYGFGYGRFPYYAYGYPWGYNIHVTADRKYEAVAYIRLLKEKEAAAPSAGVYNAVEVKKNLEERIKRPD